MRRIRVDTQVQWRQKRAAVLMRAADAFFKENPEAHSLAVLAWLREAIDHLTWLEAQKVMGLQVSKAINKLSDGGTGRGNREDLLDIITN